jgi:ubiquinone/menaquinone biosynthesis C-methylase UbiE
VALSDLFGQNAIVRLLFGDSSRTDLAVTMIGVKLGERVLVAGGHDPRVVVGLAAKSGMSGHVVVLDTDPARLDRITSAAAQAGVLVECEKAPSSMMPFDGASFDLAVVGTTAGPAVIDDPRRSFLELVRVLRPGGRVVVVQQAPRGGVVGSVQATVGDSGSQPGDLRSAMTAAGFRGVRILTERDGLQFFEGGRSA